jgi:hypothetical protein
MPKFIQKYQCLFCNSLFWTEEKAIEHEDNCEDNPETKKCGTCKYLVSDYYSNWVCCFKPEDGSSTYEYYDDSLTCPYHKLEERK